VLIIPVPKPLTALLLAITAMFPRKSLADRKRGLLSFEPVFLMVFRQQHGKIPFSKGAYLKVMFFPVLFIRSFRL
jgi:hypothetical protein